MRGRTSRLDKLRWPAFCASVLGIKSAGALEMANNYRTLLFGFELRVQLRPVDGEQDGATSLPRI